MVGLWGGGGVICLARMKQADTPLDERMPYKSTVIQLEQNPANLHFRAFATCESRQTRFRYNMLCHFLKQTQRHCLRLLACKRESQHQHNVLNDHVKLVAREHKKGLIDELMYVEQ